MRRIGGAGNLCLRFWRRLALRHVDHLVNPSVHIMKCAAILTVVYFLDGLACNPDRVSSMFIGMLLVTYSIMHAWHIGTNIVFAAAIGTFWGAVATVSFDGFGGIGLARGETLNRYYVELAARLGIAVVLTIYSLMVIGKDDPGCLTTGYFSAIFVQMERFRWSVLPASVNNQNVLSTVIVHLLAMSLPLAAAFVINGLSSSIWMRTLFRDRMHHLEGKIHRNIDKADRNPFGPHARSLLELVTSYQADLQLAKRELSWQPWSTKRAGRALDTYSQKASYIYTLLNMQIFCLLAIATPVPSEDEKLELRDIIQGSKKQELGFELEKIDKEFSPRMQTLRLLMLEAIRNRDHFEVHNPLDEVVERHWQGEASPKNGSMEEISLI